MVKFLFLFLFFSINISAEIFQTKGEVYIEFDDDKNLCLDDARDKAYDNALERFAGESIVSSKELTCTSNDDEALCELKKRLKIMAGSRWTKDGAIVLKCDDTRHQFRNREIVLKRLKDMIRKSLLKPKSRVPTRPTLASKRKRLSEKKNRAGLKSNRARISTKDISFD